MEKEIRINYKRFESAQELGSEEKMLFDLALRTAANAYAPYSKFTVGAAVKLANGEIVTGSNQENMAYPSGLCAERVAIFSAASNFPGIPFAMIAVAAKPISTHSGNEVSPCGACRQVILEYERILRQPIKVISGGENGPVSVFDSAQSLLPLAFFDAGLTKGKG